MDLTSLRQEINRIDDELLDLFLRRMAISGQVAQHKRERGLPVYQPDREKELLDRLSGGAEPHMAGYVRQFFETILSLSKDVQRQLMDDPSNP